MDAQLIARAKEVRDDGSIVEVVWRVPRAIHPCTHPFKYRLYFGAGGVCRVRYDNEQGKGDHRHAGESEEPGSGGLTMIRLSVASTPSFPCIRAS